MHALVIEETGPREDWIGDDFRKIIDEAYSQLGSPVLTFENAWDVFTALFNVIQAPRLA